MLKDTFREWARVGNGSYFDAADAGELGRSIEKAIEIPYEVVDGNGVVIATGALDGDSVKIPPGTYTVNVLFSTTKTFESIRINPGEEQVLIVK